MRYGALMQFVRERWGREALKLNGSIVKALWKKWGERETEAMVKGAAALGWQDLRAVNSRDGLGRRMAMARYWKDQQQHSAKLPERVKVILWKMAAP